MPETHDVARRSIRRHLLVGAIAGLLLVGGMGGWAATTELAGAVIAPGQLVAESSVKLVQHPSGGVVVEITARDGDIVEAGEVLARLDDTAIRASLEIVVQSLRQLEVRGARLEAELSGRDQIDLPITLAALVGEPEVAELLSAEARLFDLRRSALFSQQAQLRERIQQLREEISGIETQIQAKERERALLAADLVNARALLEDKLVSGERVSSIDRELARTEGQLGQLIAGGAQARGRIAEIELQITQLQQTFLSEAAQELSSVQSKSVELRERRIAGESDLAKTTIRAPQSGQVHEVAIHTVGGVAGAGETLMRIVPIDDALSIEVRIAPQDIDQVHVDQKVLLRFSAFNLRTTPELNGTVTRLSADLTRDAQTGVSYYTARIAVDEGELSRLPNLALTSGMPVEAFIQTGERTALNYLTKPITDQIVRSFRSE
jgi:HlyD family secretion protein